MVLPKMIHFAGTDLGIFGPLLRCRFFDSTSSASPGRAAGQTHCRPPRTPCAVTDACRFKAFPDQVALSVSPPAAGEPRVGSRARLTSLQAGWQPKNEPGKQAKQDHI